jgi:uncharacterized protein YraI
MTTNSRTLTPIGRAFCIGLLLTASADLAAAEPALAIANVNMRQGPGTNFGIITTIPGGSNVDVAACVGEWCTVRWNGRTGYVIARNLDLGGDAGPGEGPGPGVGGPPAAVYVEPGPVIVGPPVFWGPRYYGGYYGRRWRRW